MRYQDEPRIILTSPLTLLRICFPVSLLRAEPTLYPWHSLPRHLPRFQIPQTRTLSCRDCPFLLTPYITSWTLSPSLSNPILSTFDFRPRTSFTNNPIAIGFGPNCDASVRDFWTKENNANYTGEDGRKRIRMAAINLRARDCLPGASRVSNRSGQVIALLGRFFPFLFLASTERRGCLVLSRWLNYNKFHHVSRRRTPTHDVRMTAVRVLDPLHYESELLYTLTWSPATQYLASLRAS